MILVCPLCAARYLVAAPLFAEGSRRVRCARCVHSWWAEASVDELAAPPLDLVEPPQTVAPIPVGSALPVPYKKPMPLWAVRSIEIAAAVLGVVCLLGLLLGREELSRQFPLLDSFYDSIGLHVHKSGDGLALTGVRSELKYEGGIMKLIVEGKISNITPNRQVVTDILASALGSDGKVMESWQIDAPAATVAPGEDMNFTSSINAPKGTVVEINLIFAEPKHDTE